MTRKKKEKRRFITIPKRKPKYNIPICEICLERIEKRKMKRGFEAKIKHKGRVICVHHYLILTGKRVYLPPSSYKKTGTVTTTPIKKGAMFNLLEKVKQNAGL